jgi:hypothetical protein
LTLLPCCSKVLRLWDLEDRRNVRRYTEPVRINHMVKHSETHIPAQ